MADDALNKEITSLLGLDEDDGDVLIAQMRRLGQYHDDDLAGAEIPAEILKLVPVDAAETFHIIPIGMDGEDLVVVTDENETLQNQSRVRERLGRPVSVKIADTTNVRQALDTYYGISNYSSVRGRRSSGTNVGMGAESTALQKKVDDMLQQGASLDCSDIHIKPYSDGVYVWMRINGDLRDYTNRFDFHADEGDLLANIIKGKDQSSNADSANKLMPNNGSFEIQRAGVPIRCRLATTPVGSATDLVQKLDVRLMPQVQKRASLEKLYYGEDLQTIREALFRSSSGMFIHAGPVGTGKTTALYADIDYLWKVAQEHHNVIHVFTIENPIEISDERYTQVQVRETREEATNLSALVALDAALRSDPDIILFGEVRNEKEAEAAMKASQTGLKMFTTLHAGNCVKTILRLLNLKVDPLSMLSELRFVLCQRLIPQLCPDCSHPHVLTEMERAILSEEEIAYLTDSSSRMMERSKPDEWSKCTNPHCHAGIIQRIAVPEYIIFNNSIRDALLHQNDFFSVDEVLKENRFMSMWEKGLRAVHNGSADLADVIMHIGKD